MYPESNILVFGGGKNGNDLVARTLSNHYRVVEADNIDDALRHTSEGVELVVGFLESSNTDSLQLLRRWKTRRPGTPFVLITDGADVGSAVQAMKLGAADCVVKPVDAAELHMLVSTVLESNIDRDSGKDGDKPTIDIPPGTSLEELERAAVEQALTQHQGNRTHAAKTLGISVRTLQRKLKAWGMPLHSHYSASPSTNGPGNNILYSVGEAPSSPFSAHVH